MHILQADRSNLQTCFIVDRLVTIINDLTLKVLNFWKFTSYCSLKPLWLGMGEVVPARTSPTLHPPSPPTASIVATSTVRVKSESKICSTLSSWPLLYVDHHADHFYRVMILVIINQMWAEITDKACRARKSWVRSDTGYLQICFVRIYPHLSEKIAVALCIKFLVEHSTICAILIVCIDSLHMLTTLCTRKDTCS